MKLSGWSVVGGALLIAACTAAPQPPSHTDLPLPKLAPSTFAGAVNLVQRLTITRLDGVTPPRQVEALLEIDPLGLKLAGFALGQRVLMLEWDGRKIQIQRHPQLPEQVDATRILRDIQLAYWPVTALNAGLPSGWQVEEKMQTRVLTHDGHPQLRVRYSAAERWNGRVELENQAEGYRLVIESTLQAGGEAP